MPLAAPSLPSNVLPSLSKVRHKDLVPRMAWPCLGIPGDATEAASWSQNVLGRYGLFYPSLARSGRPRKQATLEWGAVNVVMLGPQRKRGNQGLGEGELD